jgi:protoheme IX farnesyltransferase
VTTAAVSERSSSFVRDLVMLTKPRIISLLLVTTIAPMYIAGRPSLALVLWVLLGGYLMAGGANTAVAHVASRMPKARTARRSMRPLGIGRSRVRAICPSMSLSMNMFTVFAPPAMR